MYSRPTKPISLSHRALQQETVLMWHTVLRPVNGQQDSGLGPVAGPVSTISDVLLPLKIQTQTVLTKHSVVFQTRTNVKPVFSPKQHIACLCLLKAKDTDHLVPYFIPLTTLSSGSWWPRGLRRGSVTARLRELRVRIPLGSCLSVLSGRDLWNGPVQRSPPDCGVSDCDREASIMRSCPTGGCWARGGGQNNFRSFNFCN